MRLECTTDLVAFWPWEYEPGPKNHRGHRDIKKGLKKTTKQNKTKKNINAEHEAADLKVQEANLLVLMGLKSVKQFKLLPNS